MTPMWLSWMNPRTQKRERTYNYCSPGTKDGDKAIALTKRLLSEKFAIPQTLIPSFQVDEAPWLTSSLRHAAEEAPSEKGE